MRKFFWFVIVLALVWTASPAWAQEVPQVEVSGGYSYVRANLITANGCCFNMNGGNASVAFNLNRWFGAAADVGVYHTGNVKGTGAGLTVISYMFGPRISYRKSERATPFVQALVGGGHAGGTLYTGTSTAPGLGTNSAFALAAGGGLDVKLSSRFAVRIFQADYLYTRFPNSINQRQNQLRISVGIVVRLGQR